MSFEGFGARETFQSKTGLSIEEVEKEEIDNSHLELLKSKKFFQKSSKFNFEKRIEGIKELLNDLEKDLKDSDEKHDLSEIYAQLGNLQVKSYPSRIIPPPAEIDNLVRNLDLVKATGKKGSTDDKIVYTLKINPTQPSTANENLEKRITVLEQAVGLELLDPAQSIIKSNNSLFATSGTIIAQLERIESQLSLLTDPVVFEGTMRRVKEATAALERLAELKRRQRVEKVLPKEDSKDERVTYLYNQMLKLDSVSQLLPQLITRMHGLSQLHKQTAYFAENLKSIQSDQATLIATSSETKKGIEGLEKALIENQKQMISNIQDLSRKLNLLNK